MTDYSFMKSGFDNLDEPDKLVENVSAIIYVLQKNLFTPSLYILNMQKEME